MAERQATKNARAIAEQGMKLANENTRLRCILQLWIDLADMPVEDFHKRYPAIGPGWSNAVDEYTAQVRCALNEG